MSKHRQRRTKPCPKRICTKNCVKIGPAVPEICSQTNTQTDRQTDRNTPLTYQGRIIIIIWYTYWNAECVVSCAVKWRVTRWHYVCDLQHVDHGWVAQFPAWVDSLAAQQDCDQNKLESRSASCCQLPRDHTQTTSHALTLEHTQTNTLETTHRRPHMHWHSNTDKHTRDHTQTTSHALTLDHTQTNTLETTHRRPHMHWRSNTHRQTH